MRIKFQYTFADGFVFAAYHELPFNVLKVAVDIHGGLVAMKKIMEVEIDG